MESFDPSAPIGPPPGMVEVRHCHCPGHQGPAALPATSEFFKVKKNRHGNIKTDTFCRVCRKRHEAENIRSMKDAAKRLVIGKALGSGRKAPHFDDLLDEVYRRAGGYKRIAGIIAGFLKDDSPKGQVNRRTTAMKVFDATQKRTEAEETNEIKKAATATVKAELRQLLKAAGYDPDEFDDDELDETELGLIVDETKDGEPAEDE